MAKTLHEVQAQALGAYEKTFAPYVGQGGWWFDSTNPHDITNQPEGGFMHDNLPPEIAAPLAIIAWAAAIYSMRHWLAAWLGFKEKE